MSNERSTIRDGGAAVDSRLRHFCAEFGIDDEPTLRALTRRFGVVDCAARIEAAASHWFADLLGIAHSRAAVALAAGRLAWLNADGGRRWPHLFLSGAVPPRIASELVRFVPGLLPPIVAAAMPPASLAPASRAPLPVPQLGPRTA